ncbi:uncharacterized protein LOC142224943 [Haematobia irritans]|uniref:uncharacterized protein LOC142224943 n=1 Tax=Haematobia irritans TaxID=7368 RepID=UPI003F50BD12
MKLPPVDTDTFKGGYTAWPTFRDLFSAIYIKNSRLSNVEKLFHLTQKTTGEAREVISNVPLTNEGVALAWKNLTDRYENRRMQVNGQLHVLFNLPHVTLDSTETIQRLQRTVNSSIQTLETLGVEEKEWDPILVYICSSTLPRPFLEEFESSLDDCKYLPKWTTLDKFLTHKFKTLESVGNITPHFKKANQNKPENNRVKLGSNKFVNSFQTNISEKSEGRVGRNKATSRPATTSPDPHILNCQLCKAVHFIRDCPRFIEKNVNDRIHIVKVSHLCYNCLSSSHGVKECKSKYGCRECNLRHHTMLHKGTETQTSFSDTGDVARPSTSAAALTTQIQSTPPIESNITSLTLQDNQHSSGTVLFTAWVQIEHHG